MDNKFQTLLTIYGLAKGESNPSSAWYQTTEIILRQPFPWDVIVLHLKELEKEGLIVIKQLATASVSITAEGIEKAITFSSIEVA